MTTPSPEQLADWRAEFEESERNRQPWPDFSRFSGDNFVWQYLSPDREQRWQGFLAARSLPVRVMETDIKSGWLRLAKVRSLECCIEPDICRHCSFNSSTSCLRFARAVLTAALTEGEG